MGIAVYKFPKTLPKYHAKYLVADESVALIGTMNLTRKCFRDTRDFLLCTADPGAVASLVALFRSDVQGAATAPELLDGRLIVGPDSARERIEALLGGARRSIRIMDHKLSDPGILALLRHRERQGITVEIQDRDPSGRFAPHGRLIVIDGEVAVLGSLALSVKSLNERRELAIVIRQPEIVAKLERQFAGAAERQPARLTAAA